MDPLNAFTRFTSIIAKLRDPVSGCPWDLEQTHQTLKKYLIEEAYEVLDAIDETPDRLCEELGDLMLQIGLHAQIAADKGEFTIAEVLTAISNKLVERHPHVFGDGAVKDSPEVAMKWEKIKLQKRSPEDGVLAGIPRQLPALLRANKISKRVVACGFEWESMEGIRDKILEEVGEFAAEAAKNPVDRDALQDEFGDILFSLVQVARRYGFDPEEALQRTNRRFIQRFERVASQAPKKLEELTSDEWRGLWEEAKRFDIEVQG